MSQPTNWGVPRTDGGNEYTPEQFAERADDSFDALLSLHKGPSRPSYATAGTMWLDDNSTPWVLKLFDGSDDITIGTVNPSDNKFTPSRAVLYEAQTLNSGQKTQARENIAALSYESQSLNSGQQAQARGNIAALSYESQSLNSGQQAQARANIGLGNSATRNVGTTAGTVAAGNDSRITSAMQNKGNLGQTDLNTIGASGDYGVYYQTTNAEATPQRNYPVQTAGTLIVTPAAYGCMQMYLPYSQSRIFVRGLTGSWNGSGPWRDWGEIGSALIERGSNANGVYVRFADGTQICWYDDDTSKRTNTQASTNENYCFSSEAVFTFPSGFAEDPKIAPTFIRDSGNTIAGEQTGVTPTTVSLRLTGMTTNTTGFLGYVAYGRWF